MRVLDLFCGLKGWSQPFADRGHQVVTLDLEPRFHADIRENILDVGIEIAATADGWEPFDVILASPPCEGFSVMQIGKNWNRDHTAKSRKAEYALAVVEKTMELIRELSPRFFIIENPRAKLRKLSVMQGFERRTVTYCRYGEKRMKPTDLWGGFPPSLRLKPPCRNGGSCHVRAPRGSRTGTQGMDRAESAKIPYPLALEVCLACERDLKAVAT